jgi:galactonate dehydratase
MKILKIEIIKLDVTDRGDWILIQVHTDEGVSGLGEASQSGNDYLLMKVLKGLEVQLQGEDPFQIEVLWEKMAYELGVYSGDRVIATAISAVDQALWDIKGKVLGVPVWQLLGGSHRERVRVYANVNRGLQDRSPEGFAAIAQCAVKAGFKAVKCAPFDEINCHQQDHHSVKSDVDLGLKRISSVRSVIGPDIDLMVDCHSRFDLSLALWVASKVQNHDLFWFEEPVPSHHIDDMYELCCQSGLSIAGGESFFGRMGFLDTITRNSMHIIMPDVKHAGGITECKRIAALADIKQIPVAPHNPAGPISTAAAVHLAVSIPNFLILEYAFDEVDWRENLIQPIERIEDGFISISNEPGLGIKLDKEVVKAHQLLDN